MHSMTAFARLTHDDEEGHWVCDLRSVNHRYLEMHVLLPERLKILEMPIRDRLRQGIKRGKVDCVITYSSSMTKQPLSLNMALATMLAQFNQTISQLIQQPVAINPADIWRFPGVLVTEDTVAHHTQQMLLTLIDHTMQALLTARAREGEALQALFKQKIYTIRNHLAQVKARLPALLTQTRERIVNRFTELQATLDPSRLEQEMIFFIQKIDITEESERLEMHLVEMERLFTTDDVVGRQLDFLLQELNREANTMGAKSTDAAITQHVVMIKVLLEQIREQVQNVE